MTKTEFIDKIATKLGCTKKLTGEILDCFENEVIEALKNNDNVVFKGFGTFSRVDREAKKRMAFNKEIDVKANATIKFKPSKNINLLEK